MKTLLAILTAALLVAVLFQALPALSNSPPARGGVARSDGVVGAARGGVARSAGVVAQTEFPVVCQGGVCQMREADLEKLQRIINALVERIQELQSKTGCS